MPPIDSTPNTAGSPFQLLYSLKACDKIPVFEYKSTKTGLTVVIAEVEGPVVDGYFCIVTEAYDDDGLPHTLEHLIFLGSEDYPYKGVLDLLANRCLASGTNAWTDTDHTAYVMETVGSEGFLALMPIFLDHILYPCLTDEGFTTEVHHISPTGEDAGVVYCEMQARENSGESRMHLTLDRLMYPGKCGYSSEVGGIMKNLRESTNNEKIKNYHKQFYRPENLKIIITGKVDHDSVFKSLAKLEEKIISKGDAEPFERPWQNPVLPLNEAVDTEILYPADDESNGIYCIGWRGASVVRDLYTVKALTVLMKYLTEFSTAPLQQAFVEIADPFASKVTYGISENSETCIYLIFKNVPVLKLPSIKEHLYNLLSEIIEKENIDMQRMETIIKRDQLKCLSDMETVPHETIAFMIIGHMLYGNTKENMEERLNPIKHLDSLKKEEKIYWIDLLKKYFLNNNYVSIICKPSKDEQQRMAQEETERVKKQAETLGEEGLKEKMEKLVASIEYNDREPPQDMLLSVQIPSLKSASFHNIVRYKTDVKQENLDLSDTPVFTLFDDVNTNFVYMFAFLDTSTVPSDLRVYLPLWMECITELPMYEDNRLVPYEEVVSRLNHDTLENSAYLGVTNSDLFSCGAFSQTAVVGIQVEASKLHDGLKWLKNLLYHTVFTADRIRVIAIKILNAAVQTKRSGMSMVNYTLKSLSFIEDCNKFQNGVMIQTKFLNSVIEKLDGPEQDQVIQNFERIRKIITDYDNFCLYMAGNLAVVKNPSDAIKDTFPPNPKPVKSLNVTPEYKLLKSLNEIRQTGCAIGMGCLESTYFMQCTETLTDHEHPDVPALCLFIQYLTQAEGPLWKQIRGKGFAYSYAIKKKIDEGLLYLILAKATNVVAAYRETLQIVRNQVNSGEWDMTLLEAAKSSLVYEVIKQEKTIHDVVSWSIISCFAGIDYTHHRKLLTLLDDVTIEDLNRVGKKYLEPLFDPLKVKTAIVTDPSKAEDIANSFKGFGLNITVYTSLEDSFLK